MVRDQLGVKPLYYAVTRDGLVSSMIKTILDVMGPSAA
jgi:asparagine synthetase B (glutamine-hydrolysing)